MGFSSSFAETKLPLSGGEEILGEPVEGFHFLDHHRHSPGRTEKEECIARPGPCAAGNEFQT